MDGFGVVWDSLAQAIGGGKKKEGGKAEGGASDLGTECARALRCLLTVGQPLCQGPRPTSLHSGLAPGEISGHELHATGGETGLVLQAAQVVSGKARFGIQVP